MNSQVRRTRAVWVGGGGGAGTSGGGVSGRARGRESGGGRRWLGEVVLAAAGQAAVPRALDHT